MDSYANTGPTILKDDQGNTYAVVARSADKYIGRCSQDPTKAIAVARTADKNELIQGEFGILQWIEDQTSVVPTYREFKISDPEKPSEQCAAFTMKWIDGIHSKTNKPAFERALAAQKDNAITKQDLQRITHFITTVAGIGDLQLMIETATGRLMIVDPREFKEDKPSPDHPFIKIWNDLLTGKRQPTTAESYDKKD